MFASRLLVFCSLSLSGATAAEADTTNPDLVPFGERASMLANAGITSPKGEAVYYNPANLTRIGHPELSVSGSTYLRFDLSTDSLLVLQGEDQPFDASGFIAIPSTLVSTYEIGSWALATAVLLPDIFALKNRVTFETPDLRLTQVLDQKRQSLWIGVGGARRITPELSVGLSAFVSQESDSQLTFVRAQIADPMQVYESFTNVDRSVLNLNAIAGAFWQLAPSFGVGARVRAVPIRLTGSGDVYQSELVTSMDEDVSAEIELEDVHVSRPSPWDIGLGFSLAATDTLELLADVNVQLPATLRTMDDPTLGVEESEVVAAPRVGLATEWEFSAEKWLRLGLVYNQSAVAEPETEADGTRETYYGVTAGVAWRKGRTTTALGSFFLQGDASFIITGSDPPREGSARARLYGALLTVSYSL
jgi:hypothetical protein